MTYSFDLSPPSPIFRNKGPFENLVFWRKVTNKPRNVQQHANIFDGGYSRDPYLNSGILFMPLMPSLVSHIYGSSGDNFNEKSERVTILAFKVTFGKFSFLQVKIHINAYKFHFGQNFQGPPCFIIYGCAEYRCPKRATGETPYFSSAGVKKLS